MARVGVGRAVAKSVRTRHPISIAGELNAVSSAFRPFSGSGGTGQEFGCLCQAIMEQLCGAWWLAQRPLHGKA